MAKLFANKTAPEKPTPTKAETQAAVKARAAKSAATRAENAAKAEALKAQEIINTPEPTHHYLDESAILEFQSEHPMRSAPPAELLARNDERFGTAETRSAKAEEEARRQEDKRYQALLLKARQRAVEASQVGTVIAAQERSVERKRNSIDDLLDKLSEATPDQLIRLKRLLAVKTHE